MHKEKNKCQKCGKEIQHKSVYCFECRKIENEKNIPPKEELFELLLKYPILQIGEIYNVSDNTVRKWCKKYNLPFKQKDLMKLRKEKNTNEIYLQNIRKPKTVKERDEKYTYRVIQYDKNGNFIKEHKSAKKAIEFILKEINSNATKENMINTIRSCCGGHRKTAYGYIWKYAE